MSPDHQTVTVSIKGAKLLGIDPLLGKERHEQVSPVNPATVHIKQNNSQDMECQIIKPLWIVRKYKTNGKVKY